MTPLEFFGVIALLILVAGVCYRAGWLAANAYLVASESVAKIALESGEGARRHASSLDKLTESVSGSAQQFADNTERINARQQAIEDTLFQLFQGFERAGFVRAARSGPGPQRGEKPEDDG